MRRVVGNGAQSRCSVSLPRFKTFPSYKPFSVTSGWQVFAVPTSRPLTGITLKRQGCCDVPHLQSISIERPLWVTAVGSSKSLALGSRRIERGLATAPGLDGRDKGKVGSNPSECKARPYWMAAAPRLREANTAARELCQVLPQSESHELLRSTPPFPSTKTLCC
jgi:hypothetical protein